MAKDTGTVNIHGKEYKTVAARVQQFREEYKHQYSIVTEIVSADDKVVVMKASIYRVDVDPMGNPLIATGHAEESRTSSQINRTSALENAETSAIGRALAAFGLAGTEFASADEVANAIHQQSAPRQKAPAKASVTHEQVEAVEELMAVEDEPPMSLKQRGLILMLGKKLNLDPDLMSARVKEIKTSKQASEAIDKLQAQLDA